MNQKLLLNAINDGNIELVLSLIELVDLTIPDLNGMLPIHHVAKLGNVMLMNVILNDIRVDPTIRDDLGMNALHYACEFINPAIVISLINDGRINVNIPTNTEKTPLQIACQTLDNSMGTMQRIVIVQNLLDVPYIEVASIDDRGNTALHYACDDFGCYEIVKLLLRKQPLLDMLNEFNKHGKTPFHIACSSFDDNNLNVIKLLLQYPELDKYKPTSRGESALYLACTNEKIEVVKYLLDNVQQLVIPASIFGNNIINDLLDKYRRQKFDL